MDDILFLWRGNRRDLDSFCQHLNSQNESIKLTFDISETQVHFLDLTIHKTNVGTLHTTLYKKPTDKNLITHHSSLTPNHTLKGIIYSQALRYSRNITDDNELEKELKTLKGIFLARGYPTSAIDEQFARAINIPRTDLLINKAKEQGRPLTIAAPFHPDSIGLTNKIKKI